MQRLSAESRKGRVAIYGDISLVCHGDRNDGRGEGSAIKVKTEKDRKKNGCFFWWRVVRKKLIPKDEEARELLVGERVKFWGKSVCPCDWHNLEEWRDSMGYSCPRSCRGMDIRGRREASIDIAGEAHDRGGP